MLDGIDEWGHTDRDIIVPNAHDEPSCPLLRIPSTIDHSTKFIRGNTGLGARIRSLTRHQFLGSTPKCAYSSSGRSFQLSRTTWNMLLTWSSSVSIFILFCTQIISADILPRADKHPKDPDPACTVTNPTTGEFFDLRPLIRRASDKLSDTVFVLIVELIGVLTDKITDIISLLIYVNLY
jgi:hypothetical protein